MPVNPPKVPMPAAAAFDVDSLIAPLAGQDPAGDSRAYVIAYASSLPSCAVRKSPRTLTTPRVQPT